MWQVQCFGFFFFLIYNKIIKPLSYILLNDWCICVCIYIKDHKHIAEQCWKLQNLLTNIIMTKYFKVDEPMMLSIFLNGGTCCQLTAVDAVKWWESENVLYPNFD